MSFRSVPYEAVRFVRVVVFCCLKLINIIRVYSVSVSSYSISINLGALILHICMGKTGQMISLGI